MCRMSRYSGLGAWGLGLGAWGLGLGARAPVSPKLQRRGRTMIRNEEGIQGPLAKDAGMKCERSRAAARYKLGLAVRRVSMNRRVISRLGAALAVAVALTAACTVSAPGGTSPAGATADEAKKFLDEANATLLKLSISGSQAGWVAQNFITDDTEALDARGTQQLADAGAKYAKDSTKFDKMQLAADQRRELDLLKVSLVLATPANAKEAEEVTQLNSRMRATYGKGKWCPDPAKPDQCHNIDEVTKVLANSRNEKELRREWEGWNTISPPMKKDYARFAELSNKGAKELGFADTGAMWRSKYDMPPDEFTKELDRLWGQVRPRYLELHAYMRMKLRQKYGAAVPANGPMPAHLLGNIW